MATYGITAGAWGAAIGVGVSLALAPAIVLTIALAGTGAMAGYCDWFFNWRLVCIGKDEVFVGTVDMTEVSFDGDFCFNLIPAPHGVHASLTDMQTTPPQDKFMRQYFSDLPFHQETRTGESGTVCLHNEIEGTRMRTVCDGTVLGSIAGAAVAVAVAASCLAAGWFWLLCIVIALLVWAAIAGAGAGAGYAAGDEGSPEDIAGDPNAWYLRRGECVAIIGDWVYDYGHEGWHEFHPVKKLFKIGMGGWVGPLYGMYIPAPCQGLSEARIQEIADRVREPSTTTVAWQDDWVAHEDLG